MGKSWAAIFSTNAVRFRSSGPITVDPAIQNKAIGRRLMIAVLDRAGERGAAGIRLPGGGFLVPTRNSELLRWCLEYDLRLVHQMTLMTIGLYNEPGGAYLPSVLY